MSAPSRYASLVLPLLLLASASATAAGSGPPARGIPYVGYLEESVGGVTQGVVGDVDLTFLLYDDANPASATSSWTESATVSMAGGKFTHVLGSVQPLPAWVFKASGLYLQISVEGTTLPGLQRLYPAAQSVRAGEAVDMNVDGNLFVAGGRVTDGATLPGPAVGDLGLYSQRDGRYMRFVTTNGQFHFFSDGATSSGYGGTPLLSIDASGNTGVAGNLQVVGKINGTTSSAQTLTMYGLPKTSNFTTRAGRHLVQASCTAWAAAAGNPIALQGWIDGNSIGLTYMATNVGVSHMTLPTLMSVVNLSAGQHSITIDEDSNNDFPGTRIDANDVCNISILEIP